MDSNLKPSNANNNFKEVLLKKLSYAVTFSVLSHLIVIFMYTFIINFSVQPLQWLRQTFSTLTSFTTWLHLIPFASIIFAQIMICAKDYVLKGTCQLTRFRRFISIFSVRTFLLGLLHVAVGGVAIWLYLSLSESQYQNLYNSCKDSNQCLVEGSFFMILSGLWTGLYFFVQVCLSDKNLIFPVIQQRKLLYFKARFLPLLKESKEAAFYPTAYFFLIYYSFGSYLRDLFAHSFKLHVQDDHLNIFLYGYVWIFATLYILNMNLMRFFFELFLTEPIVYPITTMYDTEASLSEAFFLNNMPILQHLACLDLYLLSMWSPQRRQSLFTLSQPGGHSHTWNHMVQGALQLINEFTHTLNRSADVLTKDEKLKPLTDKPETSFKSTPYIQHQPSIPQVKQKYPNMRNISMSSLQQLDPIMIEHQQNMNTSPLTSGISETSESVQEKLNRYLDCLKSFQIIKYVFGELPEVQIQHCLRNGQLIVWTTQGLSNIAVASFTEDPYGVVQKDLPVLITSLIELKLSIEKLNKVPMFSRKGPGFDYFSFKMKNSVNTAVKRSLCNICLTFGSYLQDIPLKRDIALQLQCYL
ncbi:hypothetical protein ILUMI_05129 [Ignelater luminosus]|uniref:Nucleoporin NDC1 n=1 Tax=Ignelater luminosus TaxID=2038154 RepID=A0A8K0D7W4_IGNLU|nr:hypothetical protein ILUMI_05129 [Ignelater luminosus]